MNIRRRVAALTAAVAFGALPVASARADGPHATTDRTSHGVAAPYGLNGTHVVSPDGVSYTMYSGTTASFDGLPMAVDVTVPDHYQAPGPLVVMMHGFTGDRTTFESATVHTDPSAPYAPELDDWNNLAFAQRGYLVLNYSARGFEASCGPKAALIPGVRTTLPPACTSRQYWTHFADPKWEIHDAQFLIGELVDEGLAASDRIGVTGWSYGAGHSLLLAMYDHLTVNSDGSTTPWLSPQRRVPLHIAAAVPVYGWASLSQSLLPNGRATETAFDAHLLRTPVGVPYETVFASEFAQENVKRFHALPGADDSADLNGWAIRTLEGDPFHDDTTDPVVHRALDEMDRRSPLNVGPYATVPIYMVQGFTDAIFPAVEAIEMRNALLRRDPNYPIKSFFGDVGHIPATNPAVQSNEWHATGHAFFDHYLQGVGPAPAPDVTVMTVTCAGQPQRKFVSRRWGDLSPGRGVVVTTPPGPSQVVSSATPGYAGVASDPVTTAGGEAELLAEPMCVNVPALADPATAHWDVALARRPLLILGTPVVNVTTKVIGSQTELHVRLWDLAADGMTQTLISHGTYRYFPPDSATRSVSFAIGTAAWELLPGHSLRVEVAANAAPGYQPSNEPATVIVDGLTVHLPSR